MGANIYNTNKQYNKRMLKWEKEYFNYCHQMVTEQELQTQKALDNFWDKVIPAAQRNLGASGKDTSGKLRKTMRHETKVSQSGQSFSSDLYMESYGVYVDAGRDGTEKKNSYNGLFKKHPRRTGKGTPWSKKGGFYVLKKWIKAKPVRLRESGTGRFTKSSTSKINSLAFLINRKIKRRGIKATNFLSEPFKKYFKELPDKVVEAFGLDVENMIELALKD